MVPDHPVTHPRAVPRYRSPVPGAIIFVVAMVFVVPVAVMFGGAIWSALTGWLLVEDTERSAGEAGGRAGAE